MKRKMVQAAPPARPEAKGKTRPGCPARRFVGCGLAGDPRRQGRRRRAYTDVLKESPDIPNLTPTHSILAVEYRPGVGDLASWD